MSEKTKITDKHVGMYAKKKLGFYSGLIGKVVKKKSPYSEYALTFKSGSIVTIVHLSDVEFIDKTTISL